MPRPCLICSDHRKLARAAELVAAGNSDQAVANTLNAMTPDMPAMSLMAVSRHRRSHILAPAKALAEAAGKGREVAEQRAQVLAAAEAGDPSAFVALAGIVADLQKVHERLEATADAAARDNQRLAVASLSAQQLRATEVRSCGRHNVTLLLRDEGLWHERRVGLLRYPDAELIDLDQPGW